MADWREETKRLRRDAFLAAYAGGMGHLASAFSCMEILYALYVGGVMRVDPRRPEWEKRDRFVLSKGHGSLALYAVLCEAGYFDRAALMRFTRPESPLGGEPSRYLPYGIEASTGSLGHGLPLAVGMALAGRDDPDGGKTYVLLGDGECEEGSVWEALMAAARYDLHKLVILIDQNGIQKMDTVETVAGVRNWEERLAAFGLHSVSVDGHDVDALTRTLNGLPDNEGAQVVIAHTVKGKGVSLMEGRPEWHWRMPNKRELKAFMQELDLDEEALAACR